VDPAADEEGVGVAVVEEGGVAGGGRVAGLRGGVLGGEEEVRDFEGGGGEGGGEDAAGFEVGEGVGVGEVEESGAEGGGEEEGAEGVAGFGCGGGVAGGAWNGRAAWSGWEGRGEAVVCVLCGYVWWRTIESPSRWLQGRRSPVYGLFSRGYRWVVVGMRRC